MLGTQVSITVILSEVSIYARICWGHYSLCIAAIFHYMHFTFAWAQLKRQYHEIFHFRFFHKSYTVLRPSHIPLKKVSPSTRARTQSSCTVSVLVVAFVNPVICWWIHICTTAYDKRKRYTAGKYTGHASTSGSRNPYSAVPSHWSLIGRLD